MNDFIEGKIREFEEEAERPLGERLGKMALVGLVGLLASAAAEALFDKFTIDKRRPPEFIDTDIVE